MTFAKLFKGVRFFGELPQGEPALVTQDSRKVSAGAVFVCITGLEYDGHRFAQQAVDNGAALIVTQRPLGFKNEVCVDDTRAAYAALCANYFEHPADRMILTAVTGTNGKTTVSDVLKQILRACGKKCGLIGSVRSEVADFEIPAKFTTPDPWDLNALLSRMVAAGCTHAVMEASSQALDQGRLHGVKFKLAVFTNLSQDHLDYHGDMETYFKSKCILMGQSEMLLANEDDSYGKRLLEDKSLSLEKYSFSADGNPSDFSAMDIRLRAKGVRFALLGDGYLLPVSFGMPGEYSVSNGLAALGAAILLGCEPEKAASALAGVKGVPGRCEVLYSGDFTVIRDFAHTADGIDKLLAALRPFAENRLVVLYGCTGDRDAEKRYPMGQAAAKHGDLIYLSSDNPRTENPLEILADAQKALKESGKPYVAEADREKAVIMALSQMEQGDVLVLCGKGHEDYQVMDGYTVYQNEKQIVEDWIEENIKGRE